MHINIQGRHLKVTPALHSYVKEKIKKIKYYFDHIVHAHVVLEVIKQKQIAEVTLTIEHHHFHNKVASDDMYKSIDKLFDKIDIQVRRYKEHLHDAKIHREKKNINSRDEREISELNLKIDDVIISSKPMSTLEAVLQLKVDSSLMALGYFIDEDSNTPSFLVKKGSDSFVQVEYDSHWEMKELTLEGKEKLNIDMIESIKIVTESIEDALDYIETHDVGYRFFRSVRTDTVMFLAKVGNTKFSLLREKS